MSAILVLIGVLLLGIPGMRALRPERLHPAQWASAAAGALRAGQISVRLGLFLGAAPTLLHAVGVEEAANACHELFGPLAPGGAPTGWASAAAFAGLTLRNHHAHRAQRRAFDCAHVEAWIGAHRIEDGIDVVTLPVDALVAYAVPRDGGQIVVSDALVRALEERELRAVIAHERSHLTNHHARLVGTAAGVEAGFAWWPPAMRSAAAVRLAVERWADEDAAPSAGERAIVCSALIKTVEQMLSPTLAFAARCTLLERLEALAQEPPHPTLRRRVATLAPLVTLLASAAAVIGLWSASGEYGLLSLYQYCLS